MAIYKSGSEIKIVRKAISWKTWFFIVLISIIVALIVWYAQSKNASVLVVNRLSIVVVLLLPQLMLFPFFLSQEKILINKDKNIIVYKNKTTPLKNIKRIQIILKRSPAEFSLNLYNDESSHKPFKINLALFSKEECQFLINLLLENNPRAEIDEFTKKLSQGDFSDLYVVATETVAGSFLKEYRKGGRM